MSTHVINSLDEHGMASRRDEISSKKRNRRIIGTTFGVMVTVGIIVTVVLVLKQKEKEDNGNLMDNFDVPDTANTCKSSSCKTSGQSITKVMNPKVKPCQDFFEYVCGNFAKQYPYQGLLATDYFTKNAIDGIRERIELMEKLMTKRTNTVAVNNMAKLYRQCVDARVISDLNKLINRYGGFPMVQEKWYFLEDVQSHFNLIAEASKLGLGVFLEVSVIPDIIDGGKYILAIARPKMFPSSSRGFSYNYIEVIACEINPACMRFRGLSVDISNMVSLMDNIAGLPSQLSPTAFGSFLPADHPENLMYYSVSQSDGIPNLRHLKMKVSDLQDKLQIPITKWNIREFLQRSVGVSTIIKPDTLVIVDILYLSSVYKILEASINRRNRDFVNSFVFSLLIQMIPKYGIDLNDPQAMSHQRPNGISRQSCLRPIDELMPFAITSAYVKEKDELIYEIIFEEIKFVVADVKRTLDQIFDKSIWLDATSKSELKNKLKNQATLIGFPKWIMNPNNLDAYYDVVDVETGRKDTFDDFLNATMSLMASKWQHEAAKQGLNLDRANDWTIAGQGVLIANAWNHPLMNTITIPVGLFSFPFYDREKIRSWIYGGIGFIIAHEVMHSFEMNGINYDHTGRFRQILSKSSRQYQESKATCIANYYSKTVVENSNKRLTGMVTINEDIPDHVGLLTSHTTFMKSTYMNNFTLPRMNQFSPEQLFFVINTMVWCQEYKPQYLEERLKDVHTLNKYRILLTYQNSPEFNKAFNCPSTSRMNQPNKCRFY